jgi:hypothetical protein
MFKRLLFLALLFPSLVFADITGPTVWERAAYGSVPGATFIDLYGYNGAIPATFEAVWPESADYIPLQAALSAPYCASTSAADAAAGTGARTIRVTGITTTFAAFSETVTLNGQTSVVLATANILLIHDAEVLTAGSGLMNAGAIACGTGANTAGDPAVVHLFIPISSETAVTGVGNRAAQFFYGVPAGYTMLCKNFQAGSVFATAASSLQIRIEGYTNSNGIHKQYLGVNISNAGGNPSISRQIVKFPEKTIIIGKLAGPTGSNTGPVHLSAECLLLDNAQSASTGF